MTRSEIVYIHPLPAPAAQGTGRGASYPVLPVGLVGHINLLREAGWTVEGLNLGVERTVSPSFDLDSWMRERSAPALLLVDFHWYEHAFGALDVAERARAAWPHSRVVLGGLSATHFHRSILERSPAVDAVICGAAEDAVLQLAQQAIGGSWMPWTVPNVVARDPHGQLRHSTESWLTPPALLDRLDSVDLSWLRHATTYRRMMHSRPPRVVSPDVQGQWILSGRGCAFACGYCGGGRDAHRALSGITKVARRDPVRLAGDVNRLQGAGVQQVAPSLDPDMMGRHHQQQFFGALQGRPGLYVESYQLPSLQLLDSLADRADLDHTEVALTPLSGSNDVRARHGKRYDNAQLLARVQDATERGVALFVFFSLNLPGETEKTVTETTELVEQLMDVAAPDGLRAISICHTIDPRSPMADRPGDFGIAEVTLRTLGDYVDYACGPRPFTFADGERGFRLEERRDLVAMVHAWDRLASVHPSRVYPVPRV